MLWQCLTNYNMNAEQLLQYKMSVEQYQAVVDQLPDKKFYEFVYHKYFNPKVQYHSWQPWDQWNYPVQDAVRFKHVLLNNRHCVQGHSVVDFGCHLGYMSMIASYLGASQVTGTNVRVRELDLSRELCNLAGCHNVSFVLSNVTDCAAVTNLCNNHDTVLFSGLIYHLNNQIEILQAITNSSAQTVIIDNLEHVSIKDSTDPLMILATDDCTSSEHAYTEHVSQTMIVGYPNQSWIDHTMKYLGWQQTQGTQYQMVQNKGRYKQVSTWTRVF